MIKPFPKPLPPYPKIERLPRGKRVTAIIGFNYLDGVLLLADTEETLGDSAKSQCDKLYRFNFPSGTVITGGAGDSHHIDCANQDMQMFFSSRTAKTLPEVLEVLNEFAGRFFKKVILPAKDFSSGVEMLIAVNCDRKSSLLFSWKTNRVVWIAPPQHASIGSGMSWTHPLLRDIQFSPSKESALFHGLKVMYQTKRAVAGVGGKTEAVALQNDSRTHWFGTMATQKVEDLVVNYEEFKIKFLDGNVSTIAVDDPRINPELERNVESNWADLARMLKEYRESYRNILKPQLDAQKSKDQ
jgi:20S proteasome alpha/beta subunit